MIMSRKRLLREREWTHELSTLVAWPTDDLYTAYLCLLGPAASPYQDGLFLVRFSFPTDYPFKPPKVKFETKIYHPNINTDGCVSMELLSSEWSPALTFKKLVPAFEELLLAPNPDHPLVPEIAQQFRASHSDFLRTAADFTRKFAQ